MIPRRLHIVLAIALIAALDAAGQGMLSGLVLEADTNTPLPGAAVSSGSAWTLTDADGNFSLKAAADSISITCLGYKTLVAEAKPGQTYRLQPDIQSLREVVVTASENRGLTSASRIGLDAINHIQPSSIADVLELLPGGVSHDPSFSAPQTVNLRAAGSMSDNYATSALGTGFVIDGRPVSNNANLQYTPGYSSLGSDFVNMGTDMRTISTEDVETVNVVRGIASVEHGDMTSGLILLKRITGGNDIRLRFKSDMSSKLFYAAKGWEWGGEDRRTLNVGANFMDSRSDPRNSRQNYKRLTSSIRTSRTWSKGRDFTHVVDASLDYTGSFDTRKSDQDLDQADGMPIETYKSTYNRISLGAGYNLTAKDRDAFFRSFTLQTSLSYERDLIDRWRYYIGSSETPSSISREAGEYDAIMIPSRYEASLQVDGRPFYTFVSAIGRFHAGTHDLMAGVEWNFDKNYGLGSVFDVEHPFTPSMSARPRAYKDIPGGHNLSFFAEDNARYELGSFGLEWTLGLRASMMPGLGKEYELDGKPFLDPRANIRLELPDLVIDGYKMQWGIYGGAGLHTKFPTTDMLFPDKIYGDKQQLNYWPAEKELRRINFLVYTISPVNYALMPARNLKWEVGADAVWNGWTFSIDYFVEDMTSGFRNGSEYIQLISKDYDESVIDKSSLVGPPSLDGLPFVPDTTLVAYGFTTNGSRTLKKGVEYTLSTQRIPAINTRLTINGAWFRTELMNSSPEYERPSVMLNGKTYPYIAIYDKNDGRMYDSFNTNFLFDTQVPSLGLVFTTSFQCMWFTGQQSYADDSVPVAYLDKNLVRHEYTAESDADGVLHMMVRDFTSTLLEYRRIPFSMDVNLKLSKQLYSDKMTCSLFVNRLFTLAPDYEVNGVLKRRSSVPYFGMEINFRL